MSSGQEAGGAGAAQDTRAQFLHEADLLDDRYEFGRRHWAANGVAPARERLECDDPSRFDIDDRLEVDVDRLIGHGCPELELDEPANLNFGVHRLFEGAPAPPSIRFRRIERDIRVRQEGVGREAVIRGRGAADAGADDDFAAVDDHGTADFLDDAPGDRRKQPAIPRRCGAR